MRPSDITDGIAGAGGHDRAARLLASMRPSDITDGITLDGTLKVTVELDVLQ